MTDTRIVRFFADHACISDIAMCQGLSDAMGSIANGEASVLVVSDMIRLTKSVEDLIQFVEKYRLLRDGPALISVSERLDTRTAEGRWMLGAAAILVRLESGQLARGA